jgi:hypothetical protein
LQCLSPAPHYTEQIHETLKIFDRMFAEFEFSYVSCMVHVKTVKGGDDKEMSSIYMSLNAGRGGGVAGSQPMSTGTAVHMEPT